jgi:hypothetical protein
MPHKTGRAALTELRAEMDCYGEHANVPRRLGPQGSCIIGSSRGQATVTPPWKWNTRSPRRNREDDLWVRTAVSVLKATEVAARQGGAVKIDLERASFGGSYDS